MYRLGIDIGGTKFNLGLLDEEAVVFKCAEKLPEDKGIGSILRRIKDILDSCLAENGISYDEIISCGIGVPGTISKNGKFAIKVPNLGWENAAVGDEFEALTGIPTRLIQDSRAAAFGEYTAGKGRGRNIVVCVTLGTGIGTGIVMNGAVFDGALGSAGELGHVPVVVDGRLCGCGKVGCLENYVAGKGLDLTATELYGEGHTAADIFENAERGDAKAAEVLDSAVHMLGNVMVAMINLLSPDCLLFSGGMSSRKQLFINPLIEHIKSHSYSTALGDELYIDCAGLGADAPMIGAALFPKAVAVRKPEFSASIMCADLLHLERELKDIERAGIRYIHFDVMDGHFVPNLMLPPEIIDRIRVAANVAYDIHLMVENPENIIPRLKLKEGDLVSVHYESTPHVQRALSLIRSAGAIPVLAINPSTSVESVREMLDDVDMILLMTVNPGFSGQKLVAQSFDKIRRMRTFLDGLGYRHVPIEVDGNCSFENVPRMYAAGADIFVVGTSSVFSPGIGIEEGVKKLRDMIQHYGS